ATTDGAGRATLVAQGEGTRAVTATRAGDIRSAARPVCSFTSDPAVCNMPADAPAAGGAATGGGGGPGDRVAPGSRITAPRIGRRHRTVRVIRGVAGPDRSDIARVDVALARRVGTQCRFRARSGGLTRPRPCSRPLFVRARSTGGYWALGL